MLSDFFLHNALSIPGVEYLLSFFGCSPSPGGEGHWEVRCLKTSWSLFCEQPVFVVLAGPNTAGQRVYNWKLLEAHFGKEQLILMVLFKCLAHSNGGDSKPKTKENAVWRGGMMPPLSKKSTILGEGNFMFKFLKFYIVGLKTKVFIGNS